MFAGPRTRWLRIVFKVFATTCLAGVLAVAIGAQLGLLGVHVVSSSSMQPTLKVGDLLVTRTVPAVNAEVGDIVTLHHPDGQLVTHRVLDNVPDPDGEGRLISMQGDDNEIADSVPYPAEEVHTALFSVPFLGGILQGLAQPPVSYIAILSLALIVAASFLPRRGRP